MAPDELDTMLLSLRARGLSYTAIAVVADVVAGWRLTSEQVRYRLRALGATPGRPRGRPFAGDASSR